MRQPTSFSAEQKCPPLRYCTEMLTLSFQRHSYHYAIFTVGGSQASLTIYSTNLIISSCQPRLLKSLELLTTTLSPSEDSKHAQKHNPPVYAQIDAIVGIVTDITDKRVITGFWKNASRIPGTIIRQIEGCLGVPISSIPCHAHLKAWAKSYYSLR